MRVVKSILVMLSIFFLFYLMFCLAENSFNLSNWNNFSRGLLAFGGGLISMCLGACYLFNPDNS